MIQHSPLVRKLPTRNPRLSGHHSNRVSNIREAVQSSEEPVLSELPLFIRGEKRLHVPVYTVYGSNEDVYVLEKFRTGEYKVPNLFLVDETSTRSLSLGGVKFRFFGLGGAYFPLRLFDNGNGKSTMAGAGGTMWSTVLQMGELIETARSVFDKSETRVFLSHHSPGREALLLQLASELRADFTVSAGLHFKFSSCYNEFSVNPNVEHLAQRMAASRKVFMDVWLAVKSRVEEILEGDQKQQVDNVLALVDRMPRDSTDTKDIHDALFKTMWHFNLPDCSFANVVWIVADGQVSAETRSVGFSFQSRNPPPPTSAVSERYASPTSMTRGKTESRPNTPAAASPAPSAPSASSAPSAPAATSAPSSSSSLSSPAAAAPTEGKSPIVKAADSSEAAEADTAVQDETKSAEENKRVSLGEAADAEKQEVEAESESAKQAQAVPQKFGYHIVPCSSEEEARAYFTSDEARAKIKGVEIRESNGLRRGRGTTASSPSAPGAIKGPADEAKTPRDKYAFVYLESQSDVSAVRSAIKVPDGVRVREIQSAPANGNAALHRKPNGTLRRRGTSGRGQRSTSAGTKAPGSPAPATISSKQNGIEGKAD